MEERKSDVWDSVGKVGGIVAAGIFGSVFLPSLASWLISDWIAEQLAENPSQLLLCCALALAAGAGLACSISVPLFKRRVFRAEKDADAKNASRKRIEELEEKLGGAEADAAENKRLLEDLRSNVALYAAASGKDVDEFIREAVEKAVDDKVDERKLVDQAVRKVEEKRERQEDPRYRKYRNLQAEREYKAEKRKKRGW